MTQPYPHKDILNHYINQNHLNADASSCMASRFNKSRLGLLQIDNFLKLEIAELCSNFLTIETQYDPLYGYTDKKPTTDRTQWLKAPESERAFYYEMLEASHGNELNANTISFIKLRHFLKSDAFRIFIEAQINRKLSTVTPIRVHHMKTEHFLKPHSDQGGNREIAFILYLSPDWKVDYGGNLIIVDRDANNITINPTYNSLVLFDVNQHHHHYVSDITEEKVTAHRTGRISINGWFLGDTQEPPLSKTESS